MIKVVIADDVMILCQGLKAILEQDEEIEVAKVVSNGKEAYEACEEICPDVVLMDMRMPEFDGVYGTKTIKERFPQIKVLVLTTFDDEETIQAAVTSGADGYILKEMEDAKIISAIKAVCQGISVFGGGVFQTISSRFKKAKPAADVSCVSPRERDIIKCIVEGMDNKEIAAELFLAEGTVRNTISRILEKLELKDRTQLAIFAVKNGLD